MAATASKAGGKSSAEASAKAKKWQVATLRKKNDKVFLVLDKDVKITVNGRELDAGEMNTVFLKDVAEMTEDLDYALGQGWITEEVHQERLDRMEEKNIKYSLTMKFKE